MIAALLLGTAPAGACESARAEYDTLSLEAALEHADAALAKSSDRPLECLEVKALSLMLLGRNDEARAALTELFRRDVAYLISDRSLAPAQQQLIEQARESARPMRATVNARWLGPEMLRLDVVLAGDLQNASDLRYTVVFPNTTSTRGVVPLTGREAVVTAQIPLALALASVSISAQVIDPKEQVLYSFEHELLVPARPSAPLAGADEGGVPWLVWVGIGAGVIAASVAIAVLAQPSAPCGGVGCEDVSR